MKHPGWVAQLAGGSSHTPKDCRFNPGGVYSGLGFDSQSEHVQEASDRCFSLTLIFLSLSKKINEVYFPYFSIIAFFLEFIVRIYIVLLLVLLFMYSENFQFYVDPNVAFNNTKVISKRKK